MRHASSSCGGGPPSRARPWRGGGGAPGPRGGGGGPARARGWRAGGPRVASSAVVEEHQAGAVVMRQGDPGDRFMVIEHGEVEVLVDGRAIQRLGPGAGIGEVALLRSTPRTATIVALTELSALAVASGDF